MPTSILIARLLGPVLLVIGLALLIDPERNRRLIREFLQGDALIYLAGVITLSLGLAIVNTHNVWAGWPVVITALGWLMVLGGVLRLMLPGPLKAMGAAMLNGPYLRIAAAVLAVVGAWLAWRGYLA